MQLFLAFTFGHHIGDLLQISQGLILTVISRL